MESIWQQTARHPGFLPLEQDTKTDVLIIGGGMAGLLTAHLLQQAGVPCLLLEAREICGGTTGCTTGKITAQHGLIYNKLHRRLGKEGAAQYYEANTRALEQFRRLCAGMDCDFREKSAFVYTLQDGEILRQEMQVLQEIGAPIRYHDTLPLPFPVAGGIELPGQAQFHPLKFAYELARQLPIREHTPVEVLNGTRAVCANGCSVQAKEVIVTTHFPFLKWRGAYFMKLYQHRSYVLALSGAQDVAGMYIDGVEGGLSFRNAGDLLLLGGGGHRTGKQGGGWQELQEFAKRYYPRALEVGRWAAQDCMPLDDMPYIGRYGAGEEPVYVATGFHKWGMTGAMSAAMVLCDLVRGKENPYASLFDPHRSMLHPQLLANGWEAGMQLLWPSLRRCSHMGCALKWNGQEHTWDCPCHGSRFSQQGRCLEGPARKDLGK